MATTERPLEIAGKAGGETECLKKLPIPPHPGYAKLVVSHPYYQAFGLQQQQPAASGAMLCDGLVQTKVWPASRRPDATVWIYNSVRDFQPIAPNYYAPRRYGLDRLSGLAATGGHESYVKPRYPGYAKLVVSHPYYQAFGLQQRQPAAPGALLCDGLVQPLVWPAPIAPNYYALSGLAGTGGHESYVTPAVTAHAVHLAASGAD